MFANLVAYNNAGRGKISEASVEYNANDPEDVIQLTIGTRKYLFNSVGELQSSIEMGSCMSNAPKVTCASFTNPEHGTCKPSSNFTPNE